MLHARSGAFQLCLPRTLSQRLLFLVSFFLSLTFAVCLASSSSTHAQSGRRKPPPLSPAPTPEPTPDEQGESESESKPKKATNTQLSFSVHRLEEGFLYVDRFVAETVMDAFMERLTRNKDLSASRGATITLQDARKRAKDEIDSYIVVVEFEEDRLGVGGGQQTGDPARRDTRTLSIKTYIYEPKTGALKYVDQTRQRPYRQSTTIGGVRLPLPGPSRRIERFPNELQLEQAARDSADRVMLRFNLRLPPD